MTTMISKEDFLRRYDVGALHKHMTKAFCLVFLDHVIGFIDKFYFYLDSNDLVLGCDSIEETLDEMVLYIQLKKLIDQRKTKYQEMESNLEAWQDRLLDQDVSGFDHYILTCQKQLSKDRFLYDQYADVAQTLASFYASVDQMRLHALFQALASHIDHLEAYIDLLMEHCEHLIDLHQSLINRKQNEIMKVLTIVTTIFMPLTLLVGWYGMNFKNMPELYWKHGYLGVIAFSLIILLVEIVIFNRKRWFK